MCDNPNHYLYVELAINKPSKTINKKLSIHIQDFETLEEKEAEIIRSALDLFNALGTLKDCTVTYSLEQRCKGCNGYAFPKMTLSPVNTKDLEYLAERGISYAEALAILMGSAYVIIDELVDIMRSPEDLLNMVQVVLNKSTSSSGFSDN